MSNKYILPTLLLALSLKGISQCLDVANIYSFNYNDQLYEIVLENKTWINASACAVERGGKLVELKSRTEQDTLFYYLNQANILAANTVAPDGGGASYLWLGGNDLATEGTWVWDGINAGNSADQFWQGTSSGSPVNGSYTNWGNEPDNWTGQDGLGLAITNWPLGSAGQWNDVKETNQLYYVIEYPVNTTGIRKKETTLLSVYPNPVENSITVTCEPAGATQRYTLTNLVGVTVLSGEFNSSQNQIDLSSLKSGIYYLALNGQLNGATKLVKQ